MASDLPLSESRLKAFEVARQAALEAGTVVMSHFACRKDISYKKEGRNNIVTDVDILAEKTITSLLKKEYPGFNIVTEESAGVQSDSPYTWLIDPIDGTRNYAYCIPHFCICIALAQGDDVLMGLIYDPVRDELFHAEKGRGAFMNDMPIFATKKPSLREALVSCDMGYNIENGRRYMEISNELWPNVVAIRLMGSAALGIAYTACARLDLYFHLSLYPWDIAGGILLVREAGGVAKQFNGKPATYNNKDIITSNKKIADEFITKVGGMA